MSRRLLVLTALIIFGAAGAIWYWFTPAYSAQLGNRRLQLSSNEAGATSEYALSFTLSTSGTLGSITIQFCANDPLPDSVCIAPNGFDASSAVLAAQTGPGGFSINTAASTANTLVLTRIPSGASAIPVSYHFTGLTNPTDAGPSYARISTYATDDASGLSSDYGGLAFSINDSLAISATVPPYLTFCMGITISGLSCATASGDYLDMGELSARRTGTGTSQMMVATNAEDGYFISVQGPTMTSGNNVISALTSNDVSRPGTAQFGMNLRANSTPSVGSNPSGPGAAVPQPNYNQPNSYRFVSGETLVTNSLPDSTRLYTASYIANVPAAQASGVYVSTLTYICLASF